ncbi:MAG TPA: OpgC domain-containing protein [Acidobacteriaceae bacterium]|nr:OpgC domain-containing protein [Acidobacteriaceae bacterium]
MLLPKLQRLPELDALRGLFLVWMTLTHLPTRFSDFVNQPFGFVSSAEGFVFLSALLVGRLYIRELMQNPAGVRVRLWKRSLKLYGYHMLLLVFAFVVGATWAEHAHRVAITNLLNFYLNHPATAIAGSVLLIYCPPLFDILPMYVLFLFLTPLLLSAAVRVGWKVMLAGSTLIWALAQFGLRDVVHNWIVHVTHLQIPLQETGAFNMFAWQAVWIAGLWLGATSAREALPLARVPRWGVAVSAAVCVFFVGVRHVWFGPHLTEQSMGLLLDKWQIGPLRVINIAAFMVVFYWMRKYIRAVVAREPFLTLGKASLQVFCAHLFFVFAGLALLYGEVEQLHGMVAVGLLVVTFVSLFLIAANEVRKNRAKKKQKLENSATQNDAGTQPPIAAAVSLVDPRAEPAADPVREAA